MSADQEAAEAAVWVHLEGLDVWNVRVDMLDRRIRRVAIRLAVRHETYAIARLRSELGPGVTLDVNRDEDWPPADDDGEGE